MKQLETANTPRICECGCGRPIPRNRYVTYSAACYVRYVRKPLADERGGRHHKKSLSG